MLCIGYPEQGCLSPNRIDEEYMKNSSIEREGHIDSIRKQCENPIPSEELANQVTEALCVNETASH
jgi:hypothetical protein